VHTREEELLGMVEVEMEMAMVEVDMVEVVLMAGGIGT
jgi:hypothetical protein